MQILLYHILPEAKTIAEFAAGEFIETLLQGELGIKVGCSVITHGPASYTIYGLDISPTADTITLPF